MNTKHLIDYNVIEQTIQAIPVADDDVKDKQAFYDRWFSDEGIDPDSVTRWAMTEADDDWHLHTEHPDSPLIGVAPDIAMRAMLSTAYTLGLKIGWALRKQVELG